MPEIPPSSTRRHFWVRFDKWPGQPIHFVLDPAMDGTQLIRRLDKWLEDSKTNRLTNADSSGKL